MVVLTTHYHHGRVERDRVDDRGTGIYWPKLDEVMGVDLILGVPEDEVLDLID